MTRPHRVRISVILDTCAGQHSIRRQLDATAHSLGMSLSLQGGMGILAFRESGRDWEGVAMMRGTKKTLASIEFKATSPWSRRARGLRPREWYWGL